MKLLGPYCEQVLALPYAVLIFSEQGYVYVSSDVLTAFLHARLCSCPRTKCQWCALQLHMRSDKYISPRYVPSPCLVYICVSADNASGAHILHESVKACLRMCLNKESGHAFG
jgi:hypothetical protein